VNAILVLELYFAAGLLFGSWFVFAGLKRGDPNAAGTSVWFRLLLIPCSVAFFPLVAIRLIIKP